MATTEWLFALCPDMMAEIKEKTMGSWLFSLVKRHGDGLLGPMSAMP